MYAASVVARLGHCQCWVLTSSALRISNSPPIEASIGAPTTGTPFEIGCNTVRTVVAIS